KRNKHFPKNIASNLKFLNNLQPEWKRHVTIVRQTNNLHETDFTQIYDFLKMNQEENGGIQGAQNASVQSGGNQNGLVVVPGIANQSGTGNVVAVRAEGTRIGNQARCYNCRGLGHIVRNCTARPKRRDAAYLQTQLLIAQKEEAGIQLQAEEFDFMAATGDLDEIEEVNSNCILMENLQQASTSGTQHDRAPVYDTDGSAEKFLGTIRFGNDHIAAILGYGDLKWGNITITRVYFIEGLGHNLFSVGQICDADLEVAFRRNTCFIRDLDGVDMLKGNCSTNLYTINLYDMASASPICMMMARATPTKSWLWHQRLSHLNFDTINDLAKNDLVSGLPKFKYAKEHLCPSCEQGKSKRASHPPKPVLEFKAAASSASYGFVTKDETPEVIKNFLKKIYVRLQAPVIIVRTDNETEFKNQVLKEYFDSVGITHETSAAKTP
nr:putative ribonuclease H-like domain-containing protein [Tanacetum cinerariifolium]